MCNNTASSSAPAPAPAPFSPPVDQQCNIAMLINNQYQLNVAQFAKTGVMVSSPSQNNMITLSELSEQQIMELQLYSNYYSNQLCSMLNVISILVSSSASNNNYINVCGFTNIAQGALVTTNSQNPTTNIIQPFSKPCFNDGTVNINELVDTITGMTLTYPNTYGCVKTYTVTIRASVMGPTNVD